MEEPIRLYNDSYVWHPAIGNKWVKIEKVKDILIPSETLSDNSIHEACEKKLELINTPTPHLKGYLDNIVKKKHYKKWVVLLGSKLLIMNNNLAPTHETEIGIEDIDSCTLTTVGNALAMRLHAWNTEWILSSNNHEEIIEWFEGIKCTTHLLLSLGEDFTVYPVDTSELHICNVRSSENYIGEKLFEGFLRKEGSLWKNVKNRWFILRNRGLYYYISKSDKNPRGDYKLTPNTIIRADDEYKAPNHFLIENSERKLHIWAESAAQKEAWVHAILSAIEALKVNY